MTTAQTAAARLDQIRRTLLASRPDVQLICAGKPDRFDLWMLTSGRHEYEALADKDIGGVLLSRLWRAVEPTLPVAGIQLPVLAALLWSQRADLQALFDISLERGRAGLLAWLLGDGLHDLGISDLIGYLDQTDLHQPVALADEPLPLTRLILLLWLARPDLQTTFDLNKLEDCRGLRHWFYVHGIQETRLIGLLGPVETARLAETLPILFFQTETGSSDHPTASELAQWLSVDTLARYPILRALPLQTPMPAPAIVPPPQLRLRSDGVNLIGHARGEFGVGEDVREAARALTAARIPFTVIDIPAGEDIRRGDDALASLIGTDLPFATNLFCMTGMETARLHAQRVEQIFTGRRNIGLWPWELPQWPETWSHAADLVDEIWAASRFTYGAYRMSTRRRVRHVPMAVTTVDAPRSRDSLGLPNNRFLFLFAFDGLSGFARKNPLACVEAFIRAFPRGDEPVGLIIKAMRGTANPEMLDTLQQQLKRDARIVLVDQTLNRTTMLSLIRQCDCFLSLHRSEGFGRGIAEAMLLGRPVIVTGYSGNMDFTMPGTACLVDHACRPVAAGEYPDAQGMLWAEPDIDHAAWWMRRISADADLRQRLSGQGQALVAAAYAPTTIGACYRANMDFLNL